MIRISVVLDCLDASKLAAFWAGALGYEQVADAGGFIGLKDPEGRLPTLVLQRVPERKTGKNRMHLDIFSDDFDQHLVRLKELGATVVTPEHTEPDGMRLIVLADPEGNEFCLLHPTGSDPLTTTAQRAVRSESAQRSRRDAPACSGCGSRRSG